MKENLTEQITALMFGLSRSVLQRLKHQDYVGALTYAQIAALRFLAERKQMTMKELADCLQITPPSATSLVNGLVKSGYAARKADRKDRRTIYLSLTAKGALLKRRSYKAKEKTMKELIKNLNTAEQKMFAKILKKINNN